MYQIIQKTDKNSKYLRRNFSYPLNEVINFNEMLRKVGTENNIKSLKKIRDLSSL